MESWYGITGVGAVYHTLNPRLFADQLVYIANHAEDKVLFFDITFADLVAQIAPQLKNVELYVAHDRSRRICPRPSIPNLVAYEEFIARLQRHVRMERGRREDGLRALLHLGHDGQSKRRALFAIAPTCSMR